MKKSYNRSLLILFVFPLVVLGEAQGENFVYQSNVMIPMRDGVELAANIFLPDEEGCFPTILMRTPYDKGEEDFGMAHFFVEHGYAVVIQDTRGRFDSQGEWDPFRYEAEDGYDTQQWVGEQEWCNGSIGMTGGSYVGFTQWISAPLGNPYVKTMLPMVPFTEAYYDTHYIGGALQLALMFGWGTIVSYEEGESPPIEDWDQALGSLPLIDWDERNLDKRVPYLRDWITHASYDDYWKERGIDGQYDQITVPILNVGGWYDIFSKATLEMIDKVHHQSKNPMARRNQFVIMGPWGHGVNVRELGELDFGEGAKLDFDQIQKDWFDYWLKKEPTGVEDWAPLKLFVMGENKWREEYEWPLARTEFTKYYLHSDGEANTVEGDGSLSTQAPADEETDTYVYDPEDPVPTQGGNNLFGAEAGPYDQREIEKRDDVLVYTTPELKSDVEVTGPVKLILYASSRAPDTDFTGKLVDVHPNGKAYNLCEGIIRARCRESMTDPRLIVPEKIYRYEIDLWVTSNLFKKGHRIRLEVSSSNFPRFDRNPNTGNPLGMDDQLKQAKQTIYHNEDYPSHLVLPIIPR